MSDDEQNHELISRCLGVMVLRQGGEATLLRSEIESLDGVAMKSKTDHSDPDPSKWTITFRVGKPDGSSVS